MLDTARLITTVLESTATSGTTTTIGDTNLTASTGTYNGGTAWLLSGSMAGQYVPVKTNGVNTLTLAGTLSGSVIAGTQYAVADAQFPTWDLKQAVTQVLHRTDIPASGSAVAVAGIATLPTGASNIKRVYDSTKKENMHWTEMDGAVRFDSLSVAGNITFDYLMPADLDPNLATAIDEAIDPNYVAWGAAAFLWRQLIQRIHKDDPTASDMLNEAKTNEMQALQQQRRYNPRNLPRSPHYSRWTLT